MTKEQTPIGTMKYCAQQSVITTNVSINGGSEKTQYSASMSYQNKQGIVRGTDFERFGGRAFLQTKALNDRLTLAFNVNAAQSKGTTVDSAKDGQSVFDA